MFRSKIKSAATHAGVTVLFYGSRDGALSALFLLLGLPESLCGVSMFVQPSEAFCGQAFVCLGAIWPGPLS